jgi:hypothetical protein
METTLHPQPHWTIGPLRQSRLMLWSGRVWVLFLAHAAMLFANEFRFQTMQRSRLAFIARRPDSPAAEMYEQMLQTPVLVSLVPYLLFAGAVWALFVWHGEGRDRRLYHWTMPLGHHAHDLSRVTVGALWLMAGSLFFCAAGVALSLYDGTPLLSYSGWLWVNCFTLPLTSYLLMSIIGLLASRPFVWIFTGLAAIAAVATFADITSFDPTFGLFEAVMTGRYGLGTALFGGTEFAAADAIATFRGRSIPGYVVQPETYVIANALWLPLAASLVVLAARRRPS